jgi:hypothetical protein
MPSNDIENARILIDQKRYAEARFALKPSDDPSALEWLAYLDRIDPPRRKKKGISWRYAFMLMMLILMGSVVAYQQVSLNNLIDRVNIVLRQICVAFPKARLILASSIVRRPITTTYDLTVGEAYGILKLADDSDFIAFAQSIVEAIDYDLEKPV